MMAGKQKVDCPLHVDAAEEEEKEEEDVAGAVFTTGDGKLELEDGAWLLFT